MLLNTLLGFEATYGYRPEDTTVLKDDPAFASLPTNARKHRQCPIFLLLLSFFSFPGLIYVRLTLHFRRAIAARIEEPLCECGSQGPFHVRFLDECKHPLKTRRRRLADSLADLITIVDQIIRQRETPPYTMCHDLILNDPYRNLTIYSSQLYRRAGLCLCVRCPACLEFADRSSRRCWMHVILELFSTSPNVLLFTIRW